MEKTGISSSELDSLVEKKIKEYASLLTEVGALYLVAKDLGIDIDIERMLNPYVKIGDINSPMEGISVKGRVVRIFPVKEYEKEGKKGKYVSFILEDETGRIRVVLWGRDVSLVEKKTIRSGSIVEIINGRVEESNGKFSLTLGINGRILVQEPPMYNVKDLKKGMRGVSVRVKVYKVLGGGKTSNGKPYTSFIGEDETGRIRVVLWGRDVSLTPSDEVYIEGGYVDESEGGLTLYVGEEGDIRVERGEYLLTPVSSLKKDTNVRIEGVVVRILTKKHFLARCEKCGGEAIYEDGKWICKECGSDVVRVQPVLSFILNDGEGEVKVFGVGDSLKDLYKDPEDAKRFISNFLGSFIAIEGSVRENEGPEVFLHKIREPDKQGIIEQLIKRLEEQG